METKYTSNQNKRGVAILVVLGVILVCSLIGIMGVQLASKDNQLTGSLVDIKSERMAALASLNLAVSHMEANPDDAVAIINAFQLDSTKQFLTLDSNGIKVSDNEPDWYKLNESDSSATKVKILGISGINATTTTVDILLEGSGRGRKADVFKVKALYRVHGLNFQNTTNTKGTSNAFLARAGVTQLQIGDSINGPVYIGGTGTSTFDRSSGSSVITKLRVEGSLLNRNVIKVSNNMIIGGALENVATSSIAVEKNLVINRGATINGTVSADGNIYIRGSSLAGDQVMVGNGGVGTLIAKKNLYVPNAPFAMFDASTLNVGTNTSTDVAYFQSGAIFGAGTTSNITGSLYVGILPLNYVINGFTAELGTYLGGTVSVLGNLSYFNSGTGPLRAGQIVADNSSRSASITGNLFFSGALQSGKTSSQSITVNGKAHLANGIDSLADGSSTYAAIHFMDSVFLFNNDALKGQSNITGQIVKFQKNISLNGYLSKNFQNADGSFPGTLYTWHGMGPDIDFSSKAACDAYKATHPGWCEHISGSWTPMNTSWRFTNTTSHWTYVRNSTLNTFTVSSEAIKGTSNAYIKTLNETSPAWVTDATTVKNRLPTIVRDTTNTTAIGDLGFSISDTLLTQEKNPASAIDTTQFEDEKFSWKKIRTRYRAGGADASACPDLPGGKDDLDRDIYNDHVFPSAKAIECLYINEKSKGNLWNGEYLVIRFTKDDVWSNYKSFSLGTIPSGVKVLFYLSGNSYGTTGMGGGVVQGGCEKNVTWYSGAPGSIQVLISNTSMQNFALGGTFYGYIYFNYAGAFQVNQLCDLKLVGAWENASKTGTVSFPETNGGELNIDFSSNKARGVFNDIATSFSVGEDPAIKFSGDLDSPPLVLIKQATLQDGWVQFERLGEFR